MGEQIKFTKEELEELTATKEKTFKAQMELGKISFYKSELEAELEIVNQEVKKKIAEVSEAVDNDNKLIEKLTQKYGNGSIDIVTGYFIKDN